MTAVVNRGTAASEQRPGDDEGGRLNPGKCFNGPILIMAGTVLSLLSAPTLNS